MLAAAGLSFSAESPGVDEDAVKASFADAKPRDLADAPERPRWYADSPFGARRGATRPMSSEWRITWR